MNENNGLEQNTDSNENFDSTENNDLEQNNDSNENPDSTENNDSNENNDLNENNSFNSNYSSEENLTTTEELTSSVLSLNDEANNLLHNYKYSEDTEENIEISVSEFMKLLNKFPEISSKITAVKSDIKLLPELMSFLKEKDHKLILNILDEPKVCFEKIFTLINNNYMEEYSDSIEQILSILPNIDKYKIYEALKVTNNNIEHAINYLYDI